MDLKQIINIQITRGNQTVTQAGFGVPLVLGSSAAFGDRVRSYTDMDSVAEDFDESDLEYKWALALFSQSLVPDKIMIGKRDAAVAQVSTLTPTVVDTTQYTVTINGTEHSITSDADATASEIVAALIAAINGGAEAANVTASGTTTLIVTSDHPGVAFSITASNNLAIAATTASHGVQDDIQTLQQTDNTWYCLILTSRSASEILQAASYIETQKKIFLACTSDSDVKTTSTTDVGSALKQKNYRRSSLFWSGDQADGPEAAWAGRKLPNAPGSESWRYATLVGITADNLTDTEIANLDAKNVNYYVTVAGVDVVQKGKVAQGDWIDNTRLIDWVEAQIQENIFALLISVEKIPYTDAGVATIEAVIRAQLDRGVRVGGIAKDPPYNVSFPKVSTIASQDRADRLLPDGQFSFTLAGAVGEVKINGYVSV
jgi:hypothetical protein